MDFDLDDLLTGFTRVGKETFKRDEDGTLWNCRRIVHPHFGDIEIVLTRLTRPKSTNSG